MFKCKVCEEKDKRIKYLESHVERLMLRVGIPAEDVYKEDKKSTEVSDEDPDVIKYGGE